MKQPMTGIAPQMQRATPRTPNFNPAARDIALRQLAAAPVPAAAPAPAAKAPGAPAPAAGQPSPYEQEWDRLNGGAPMPPQASEQGMMQSNTGRMRRMRASRLGY